MKQLFVIVVLGLLCGAMGHSYLTQPISRGNQKQSNSGCRGPACLGPCDQPASSARTPITIARGASVTLQWPRNNHAGGFIRVAWAPTSQSDSHAVFDANVQQIVCHERGGCKPDDPSNPNGGDSGPADGSFQPCQVDITVPPHLTDGLWTLQWAWFGGAFALGDYYSCVDYKISGGNSGVAPTPFFQGGDYTYPGQEKCKFFNTDRLHQCVNEPCNNPVYPASAEESGPAYGIAIGEPSTPSAPAATTGKAQPMTTGTQKPSTTGAQKPSTTGSQKPSTTGTEKPSTTGTQKPSTTGTQTHSTSGAQAPVSSGNCAALTTLSSSTASISSIDTWTGFVRVVVSVTVQETLLKNWAVEIIWPDVSNSNVISVYNAGALLCESTSPVRHSMIKPVASWAQNQPAGSVINIEVLASNYNNMNSDFIKANIQINVYEM